MSNFTPGAACQPPLAIAGEKVAVNICYEDDCGEEVIRALPEATLLVNLSNTAWFGDWLAQPQHLQIAQMRALETGRFMLRATNTGMTAIVNPRGRVERMLPPFGEGALLGEVSGYGGATPYVRWGNAAVLLLVVAGVAGSFWVLSQVKLPDARDQLRVEGTRREVHDLAQIDRDALFGGNAGHVGAQARGHGVERFVARIAQIDGELDPARYDIARVGMHEQLAHGASGVVGGFGGDCAHQLHHP